MKLTLAQTATVLGKSERQVRYMIRHGTLRAEKTEGKWSIDEDALPRSPTQRQADQMRAATAQQALDTALAPARGKVYSVTDLAAFQAGVAVHAELDERHAPMLLAALVELTRGCHAYEPTEKAAHFAEARRLAATVVTHLLVHGEAALAGRLEREMIPRLSGLIASFEKRARRRRFEHFSSRLAGATPTR